MVVLAHSPDGKDSRLSMQASDGLLGAGVGAFSFDFTGYGESEGAQRESTAAQQLDDLRRAVDFVRARSDVYAERVALYGFDVGCRACLYYCLENDDAWCACLQAPVTDEEHPDVFERAGELKAPTLFVVGSLDPLFAETQRFFMAMRTTSGLSVVDGADHVFSDPGHLKIALDVAVDWLSGELLLFSGLA